VSLQVLLSEKKPAIVERWFDVLLEDHPPETVRFLKEEKDRFANPVGSTFYQGIKDLYEELIREPDLRRTATLLDRIIRIRAVQGLLPSRALAFVLDLKKVIRDVLGPEAQNGKVSLEEWRQLESRIDHLALLSFDVYLDCREKIHEIKLNELKNRTYRLLERANLLVAAPEPSAEPAEQGEHMQRAETRQQADPQRQTRPGGDHTVDPEEGEG